MANSAILFTLFMSKSNYRRCVRLGVTGRNTETCFPGAVDQLLPGCRVSPEYYKWYGKMMKYLKHGRRA